MTSYTTARLWQQAERGLAGREDHPLADHGRTRRPQPLRARGRRGVRRGRAGRGHVGGRHPLSDVGAAVRAGDAMPDLPVAVHPPHLRHRPVAGLHLRPQQTQERLPADRHQRPDHRVHAGSYRRRASAPPAAPAEQHAFAAHGSPSDEAGGVMVMLLVLCVVAWFDSPALVAWGTRRVATSG